MLCRKFWSLASKNCFPDPLTELPELYVLLVDPADPLDELLHLGGGVGGEHGQVVARLDAALKKKERDN